MIPLKSKAARLKELEFHLNEIVQIMCLYTDVYDLREVMDRIVRDMRYELDMIQEEQPTEVWTKSIKKKEQTVTPMLERQAK